MSELLEFFRKLFDTSDWPPRWNDGKWTDFHGWLYIISDLLIWSAYFAIPLIILKFITLKTEAKFVRAYFLFAAFILACGSTHLLDAITFWFPAYRLNAFVRFITGVVSWATVFYTIKILPDAMSLKSYSEWEKEVDERQKVEKELRIKNSQLNEAQDIAKMGHWQWDVKNNDVHWSDSLYKLYGVSGNGSLTFEQFLNRVHPDDRQFVQEYIAEAYQTKKFPDFVHRIVTGSGEEKVMQSRGEVLVDDKGEITGMIGTGQDITEHFNAKQKLLDKTQELEIANTELSKFAFVASHDLQEPLRKILTFASLLQKESGNELPEKAKLYIDKITHSSGRMQRLIEDILNFSSLKSTGEEFKKVNISLILEQVLTDMEVIVERSKAQVRLFGLVEAEVIPSQIGQLFQNLLSNAIKFRKPDENPVIEITAKKQTGKSLASNRKFEEYLKKLSINDKMWENEDFLLLHVKDNGIGFDAVYAEKIFEIFQRLQNSKLHDGTGIGLAICKKIVENHRGLIVANSSPGNGASFTIILPILQKNTF